MGALDGIRVVEAGLLVQGPQAAATLHAWGAEVVKVEHTEEVLVELGYWWDDIAALGAAGGAS